MTRQGSKQNYFRGNLYAKRMRRSPTPSESLLTEAMCKRRWRFRSQVTVCDNDRLYIVDFVLALRLGGKLAIEIDGPSHEGKEQYDETRAQWISKRLRCPVLRFTAKEVVLELPRILGILRAYYPQTTT